MKHLQTRILRNIAFWVAACCLFPSNLHAQVTKQLWVGEKFQCDCSDDMVTGIKNVQWDINGGGINWVSFGPEVSFGSGGLRTIQATQYWIGVTTVTCSWDEQYYYGGPLQPKKSIWRFTCISNDLVMNIEEITIDVGETRYVGAHYKYDNDYSNYDMPFYQIGDNKGIASVSMYGGFVTGLKPGETKVIAQSKLSANTEYCKVTVRRVEPTSVSVPNITVEAEKTRTLTATVSPTYASVDKTEWYVADGTDVVSLTTAGSLTSLRPGTATVYCIVNDRLRSNNATVEVVEPAFKLNSFSPTDGATGVDVFTKLSATFSLVLHEGEQFSAIRLTEKESGQQVEGTCALSGNKLTFTPSHPLKPLTEYQFDIPSSALKNKWGTPYTTDVVRTFTTRDLQQLTLTISKPSGYVDAGDEVTLTPSIGTAAIHYTTDGTTPTTASTLYGGPITIDKDMKLRAIAVCEGYYDSQVAEADYIISNMEIAGKFPTDDELFIYDDLNPHVTFSNAIMASDAVNSVTLTCDGNATVPVEVVVADSTLFLVPSTPLQPGHTYSITIPENAVKAWQGEPNKPMGWMFTTGDFATALAAGGYELAAAMKMNGKLLTWGDRYQSGNTSTGSAEFTNVAAPSMFASGSILQTSTGYMHHAMVKDDHSLWMWGRQYCGEFGNNSTTGSATPVKVMDGVASVSAGGQTTAIVKTDGSLWMCGRNDYGQLGDSTTLVRMAPVKVLDNVTQAAAGWCASYAVTTDGKLWAWGCNDKHQLGDGTTEERWKPTPVMDDVAAVYASATESKWTAALKTDGTLWVWGETQPEPVQVAGNVSCAAVGCQHLAAVKTDGTLITGSDVAEMSEVLEFADSVACGPNSTYTLKRNGSIWAWGSNDGSLLGSGKTMEEEADSSQPMEIVTGRPYSVLGGVTARKDTFLVVKGLQTVIDGLPKPLCSVYEQMEWASEDSEIATVSERGVVRGVNYGDTHVTVKVADEDGQEYERTCLVRVLTAEEYWELLGVEEPPFTRLIGDANGDGSVTISDVTLTVDYILGRKVDVFCFENADAYGDGIITVTDVTAIVSIILGQ